LAIGASHEDLLANNLVKHVEKPGVNGGKAVSDVQEQTYAPGIRLANQPGVGQVPFSFSRFLSQDVAFKRVLALDFASPGKLEPLLGCGIGFYFRHCSNGLDFCTNYLYLFISSSAWRSGNCQTAWQKRLQS
jgi:hypothetical protein